MIRAVLFDLDGTLFDRDATVELVLREQVRSFEQHFAGLSEVDFVRRAAHLDDHGHRAKSEVYATLGQEFGLSGGLRQQLEADFWLRYRAHCVPSDGMMETLVALRDRGKALGIVTNGASSVQQGTIDGLGIRPLMNVILVSEEEGLRKPDRQIFIRAAKRIGLTVDQCCYVGDHPESDVLGAEAAGMCAVWKRTSYWPMSRSARVIDRLPQLLSLI